VTSDDFIDALTGLRSRHAFNPYTDACETHDATDAPAIRRSNLRLVLEAARATGVDSIWVARDLGYRGGRRTGLALTDEAHLAAHAMLYGRLPLAKATRGPVVAELTAKVVWAALKQVRRPVFLWNVFPLHPYAPGDPMSNRPHTRAERLSSAPLISWLVSTLQPRTIVAIGKDAATALQEGGVRPVIVRHPSYGGQREFLDGIVNAYGLARPRNASDYPTLL
jgi:Uracil DNA glycosylase superfamily